MLFIWLLLRPLLPYLLVLAGLLLGGQMLGLPVAETIIGMLADAAWSVVDAVMSWIAEQVVDAAKPWT